MSEIHSDALFITIFTWEPAVENDGRVSIGAFLNGDRTFSAANRALSNSNAGYK
ncbi:hypothetical protein ACK32R_09650 [Aeromonas dhakensis]|uniref:hypothetical protein n=1 Tax=Aeromonas TaxID=642 RepID=UPI001C5BC0D0|nr:hypothetical protein [Aeromonas hydrophila]MBW3833745.1 hypothetical protein [Aeromonas hydrophila]MBW5265768.1 hypothetical protein [Aeromonas hydrophila]MBW5279121.1 hypothetical protein [Aeromonas hydrophila]